MNIKSVILFLICITIQNVVAKEIDTTAAISIGGIQHYISIKGKSIDNPILLYLHGGPGAAVSSHSDKVTQQLEAHFIVVHWDQRGSGKTLELNKPDESPTIEIMKQDTEEMLSHLLNRFNRKQIVVLGNSWGTILGFHLAEKFPEKVSAFFAVSPIVNHTKSQEMTLKLLQNHFKTNENTKAVSQLNKVKVPFENAEQMLILHRYETVYNGEDFSDEQYKQYLSYFEGWSSQWMPLYQQLYGIDLEKQVPMLKCQVYVLIGDKDLTTHYEVTKGYFDTLKAPQKELYWLKDIGHNIPATDSNTMQKFILRNLNK
jgi:pimeloyl-ACP methyl ester carboxylesterase